MKAFLTAMMTMCVVPAFAQEATAVFGPDDPKQLMTIRSTTDIAVFGPVVDAFLETQTDIGILYEQWGSNDLFALSKADCAAGRASADMLISSGVHQMVQLVNDACAQAHRSDATAGVRDELIWRDELWGVTREPAVMVYNRDLVPYDEVPQSRFDLLDLLRPDQSRYAGRVATYDIEASGLGFLFAFIDSQEATTFGGLLESLGRTHAIATCCSAEIIDGVANGQYLVAYNVLGSYALARAEKDTRIGVIAPNDYTLVLSRAVMIPRGAENAGLATAFLDFLLSDTGRAQLREALLIVPIDGEEGELEAGQASGGVVRPITLAPGLLVALDRQKRESFIRRWRETFPSNAQ
ncbi:ABC transporter substrate-binding protein [Actibacterium lipolyticum]|uniref:Iron-binding protein n=1 Tax=Actibacterium lipolyticum TaxID=1524263 RepID=A0A238KFC0_9RHOB|nr:ABC transporter substrate-binding protein [Actibacterium lipolyticum]SMX41553.1 hypothetical protein COL8621_01778 [Actibacterium lipolyticum]